MTDPRWREKQRKRAAAVASFAQFEGTLSRRQRMCGLFRIEPAGNGGGDANSGPYRHAIAETRPMVFIFRADLVSWQHWGLVARTFSKDDEFEFTPSEEFGTATKGNKMTVTAVRGPKAMTPSASTMATELSVQQPTVPKPAKLTDAQHLERIKDANRESLAAKLAWQAAADEAKELKKVYELKVAVLESTIEQPDSQLTFDDLENPGGVQGARGGSAWRNVNIAMVAGMPHAVIQALDGQRVRTLGEFANWNQQADLTDLAGVGEAIAEKARLALERYWAANPQEGQA